MIAIASIIGIIFLIFALIIFIAESGIFNSPRHNPSGLISDDKVEALNQENLRKQIVSYAQPQLADSVNSVYVIPVSVLTLKKAETSFGSGSKEAYIAATMQKWKH